MKRYVGLMLVLGIIVLMNSACEHDLPTTIQPFALQPCPAEAIQAAEQGLPEFLNTLPPGILHGFNFHNMSEISSATLGIPFQAYTIPYDDILNYRKGTAVQNIITPMSIWYFPIEVHGESLTLLRVSFNESQRQWQASGMGMSGLAVTWAEFQKSYPQSAGYENAFIMIYAMNSAYILSIFHQTAQMYALLPPGASEVEEHDPETILLKLRRSLRWRRDHSIPAGPTTGG